jgi:4-hydroxybenzoate polyprenyltransferase
MPYLRIARPDHWVKHVFILPGIVIALALGDHASNGIPIRIAIGFISAALVASANYVINEWHDLEFDLHHPLKQSRPAVAGLVSARGVYIEYLLLLTFGIGLAYLLGPFFLLLIVLFTLSGIAYNVPPLRTKERAHLDIISEAVNNPLRLALGWVMVAPETIPPLSAMITYWFGGAFLMAAKRLAEYRFIMAASGPQALARYRRSFAVYTETTLLLASFNYAVLSAFFLAVFLMKYRIEYLLALPACAALLTYYLHLSLRPQSVAQAPEKLYRERTLIVIVLFICVLMAGLTFIDIPTLETLIHSRFTPSGTHR